MYIQPKQTIMQESVTGDGDGRVEGLFGRYATAIVQIANQSGTATHTFQGSLDGKTYHNLLATNITSGATGATATANGLYKVPVAGLNYFKIPISSYSSGGTITSYAMILPESV